MMEMTGATRAPAQAAPAVSAATRHPRFLVFQLFVVEGTIDFFSRGGVDVDDDVDVVAVDADVVMVVVESSETFLFISSK